MQIFAIFFYVLAGRMRIGTAATAAAALRHFLTASTQSTQRRNDGRTADERR
jgi:hypothetical protein